MIKMSKRDATSDINHDNWDMPYEAEDAGYFKPAAEDILQKRVMKTAKRRLKSQEHNDASKTIFSSFTGFKPSIPTQNSGGSDKLFGFLTTSSSNTSSTKNGTFTSTTTKSETTPQQKYLNDLQQLNRSVSDWIKTHVDSNPNCILTPVFNDYDKHLKQIQNERDNSDKAVSGSSSHTTSSLPLFSFVSSSTSDGTKLTTVPTTSTDSNKKTFKFTEANTNTGSFNSNNPSQSTLGVGKDSGKSPLLQGNRNSTASIFTSFKSDSTGSSLLVKPDTAALMVNPFTSVIKKEGESQVESSLSNGSDPKSSVSNKDEEGEESDEPPKVEFTPVHEEGAVFSTRCKVFVKKDNNYKERGVGTLFIKKVGEEKFQLLVRAETVLGNILVNVLLSSAIPTQRMGKNNVMLVCLPTPQDLPPPTTVLLRVKTAIEADSLLTTIDQYKC